MKVKIIHDARNVPVNGLYGRNIGPYTGIQYDVELNFGKGKVFRAITYQAYNALGLIGSEHNGIAILDETKKSVLLDGYLQESTGWFGASKAQLSGVDTLAGYSWKTFREFVNGYDRTRYAI